MFSPRLTLVALVALAACTTKEARRTDTAAPATATLAGAPASDVSAVRQAIEAANSRFTAAVLKADTAAMTAEYTDDAIIQPGDMKAASGHAAIAALYAGMLAMEKPTAFKVTGEDVIVAGEYGIQVGSYELTVQLKNGKTNHEVGKFLGVFKKQADGGYKLVRESFSADAPPAK
jgi:ketosteroid isomerase-like protein